MMEQVGIWAECFMVIVLKVRSRIRGGIDDRSGD